MVFSVCGGFQSLWWVRVVSSVRSGFGWFHVILVVLSGFHFRGGFGWFSVFVVVYG